MKLIGYFRKNIIELLDLPVEENEPIYIGEINETHMRNRHEYEYDKYRMDIENILEYPDYVGVNPHDESVMYVKEYVECGEFIRVGVKISCNGAYFARTLHLLSTYNAERYIKKGTLKKVDNQK